MTFAKALSILAIVVSLAIPTLSRGQSTGPLTEDGMTRLVKTLKIKPEAVAGMVRNRGIGFEADAATLGRLTKAGVPELVLDAITEAGKKAEESKAAPGAEQAVTFDELAEMVRFKIPDDAILERIKGSVFTLGIDQAAELKKLGASETLLKELGAVKTLDPSREIANLAILVDCSGSMSEGTADGSTKMEAAKRAAIELIRNAPEGLYLSLIIYGHDKALRCEAVRVVRPLGAIDARGRDSLVRSVGLLQPSGSTPIGLALNVAGRELLRSQGPSGVVLISDGKEMCNGDPVGEAAQLARNLKLKFGVQVVGFGVRPDEKASLKEVARAGKGGYFDAPTPQKLQGVTLMLAKAVAEGKKPVIVEEAGESGFHPLFNGQDLAGWVVDSGDPDAWHVEDGELVVDGRAPNSGWIHTDRDYADFILKLEFKTSEGANSGLAFRSISGENYISGKSSGLPPQIQITDDFHPDRDARLHPIKRCGALYDLAINRPATLNPVGTWNTMRLEVKGRFVRVQVNGHSVLETDLIKYLGKSRQFPGIQRQSGRIGLENWIGQVRFRNIEIKELAGPVVPVERVKVSKPVPAPPPVARAVEEEEPAGEPELYTFKVHEPGTVLLRTLYDNKRLVSVGREGTLRLWDLSTGKDSTILADDVKDVVDIQTSKTDPLIAVALANGKGIIWDADGKQRVFSENSNHQMSSVAFSPDGKLVAFGVGDGTLKIYDVGSGSETVECVGHGGALKAREMVFSPDGRWLATGAADSSIRIWDVATGKRKKTIADLRDPWSVSWTAAGDRLLFIDGGEEHVFDAEGGKLLFKHEAPTTGAGPSRFRESPDGQWLVAFSWRDGLFDIRDAKTFKSLEGRQYVPENEYFLLRSKPALLTHQGLRIFTTRFVIAGGQVDSGKIRIVQEHTSPIVTSALTADEKYFATADEKGIIKVWSVARLLKPE
ncbi:family 16 glycoside hydrolase [Singulisphaera rosea]